jgi:alpha-glucosidase (family GH31 glycosyl hydrolase)
MVPGQAALTDPPISALKLDGLAARRHQGSGSSQQPSSHPTLLTNGNLKVELDPATSLLTATRVSDGAVLLRQTVLQWDDLDTKSAAANYTRPGSKAAVVSFAGTVGERVYGLGEHKTGTVQQMPYNKSFADSLYYQKSQGSDVSVPMYLSSKGYAFVWNSPALGRVALSEETITWVANATLGVDMWISVASAANSAVPFPDLLAQYAAAVGPALPMPTWSTGFIQCKDRYRNQTQLLDVARGYKSRGLPISMIVIDWFHWHEMGDWALNPVCWPDPQGMVDELRTMGIELMVTFWPYIGQKVSSHWEEYSTKGYCLTTAGGKHDAGSFWRNRATPTGNAVVDATNAAALKASFDHWYEGYGKFGIKAMWMDQVLLIGYTINRTHPLILCGWTRASPTTSTSSPADSGAWPRASTPRCCLLGPPTGARDSPTRWRSSVMHRVSFSCSRARSRDLSRDFCLPTSPRLESRVVSTVSRRRRGAPALHVTPTDMGL